MLPREVTRAEWHQSFSFDEIYKFKTPTFKTIPALNNDLKFFLLHIYIVPQGNPYLQHDMMMTISINYKFIHLLYIYRERETDRHTRTHTHTHTHIYIYIYIYYIYKLQIHTFVLYIYRERQTCTHTHTRARAHTHIYIYIIFINYKFIHLTKKILTMALSSSISWKISGRPNLQASARGVRLYIFCCVTSPAIVRCFTAYL